MSITLTPGLAFSSFPRVSLTQNVAYGFGCALYKASGQDVPFDGGEYMIYDVEGAQVIEAAQMLSPILRAPVVALAQQAMEAGYALSFYADEDGIMTPALVVNNLPIGMASVSCSQGMLAEIIDALDLERPLSLREGQMPAAEMMRATRAWLDGARAEYDLEPSILILARVARTACDHNVPVVWA